MRPFPSKPRACISVLIQESDFVCRFGAQISRVSFVRGNRGKAVSFETVVSNERLAVPASKMPLCGIFLLEAARDARDRNGDNNMRALIQRVARASVTIDGAVHGSIGQGFLVLLGITDGDTADDAVYLADKVVRLRVFTDEDDKMNRSLADGRVLPPPRVRRPRSPCTRRLSRAAARAACRSRPANSART